MQVVPEGILVNQLGYRALGPKSAVIQTAAPSPSRRLTILDAAGSTVSSVELEASTTVAGWRNRHFATET